MSTPPASTPTAAPPPPIAPQIPSALFRSAPSSNVVMMIESAAGEMIAAPRPCTARDAISTPSDQASPQKKDAIVKTTTPTTKILRRPEQVGRAAAQHQEAAEGDRVGGDHPLQVVLCEMKPAADRRQGDVHDRDVEDGHEEGGADDGERLPAEGIRVR